MLPALFAGGARPRTRLRPAKRGDPAGGIVVFDSAGDGRRSRLAARGRTLSVGYGVLFLVDRYVHPVCPSCSHTHDHGHCDVELHGFSVPLLVATTIHAFIDGWSMTVARNAGAGSMRTTIPFAVLLHKIPERSGAGSDAASVVEVAGRGSSMGFGSGVGDCGGSACGNVADARGVGSRFARGRRRRPLSGVACRAWGIGMALVARAERRTENLASLTAGIR